MGFLCVLLEHVSSLQLYILGAVVFTFTALFGELTLCFAPDMSATKGDRHLLSSEGETRGKAPKQTAGASVQRWTLSKSYKFTAEKVDP